MTKKQRLEEMLKLAVQLREHEKKLESSKNNDTYHQYTYNVTDYNGDAPADGLVKGISDLLVELE